MATTQVLNGSGVVGYNSNGNVVAYESKEFYERGLLERALPELVFANYGQKKSIPANGGKKIEFRKFGALQPATTPLVEGVTPSGNNLSVTHKEAIVAQYGDYVEVSDELDLIGIDPVISETTDVLGEQAGQTYDRVVRDVICAGTNVQYVDGANNTSVWTLEASDKLTANEVKKAVRTLKKANAKGIENGLFIGIVDPDISYDLQNDSLWQDVSKYSGGEAIMKGEVGKLCGVKFIETTEVLTKLSDDSFTAETLSSGDSLVGLYAKDATKTDASRWTKQTTGTYSSGTYYKLNDKRVHCAMIIGKDAYGVVDIAGGSKPQIFVEKAGGNTDPLHQRNTIGWKLNATAVILNDDNMVRIECGVTAN